MDINDTDARIMKRLFEAHTQSMDSFAETFREAIQQPQEDYQRALAHIWRRLLSVLKNIWAAEPADMARYLESARDDSDTEVVLSQIAAEPEVFGKLAKTGWFNRDAPFAIVKAMGNELAEVQKKRDAAVLNKLTQLHNKHVGLLARDFDFKQRFRQVFGEDNLIPLNGRTKTSCSDPGTGNSMPS